MSAPLPLYIPTLLGDSMATEAPKRTKDKVCIVGCADTKHMTPFHQPDEYEFWGVNNLFLTLPGKPFTRWFEIHQVTHEEGVWLRRGKPDFRGQPVEEYLKSLSKLPCPVYMQNANPLVPNAVPYPMAEIVGNFGTYFTNTISWEIALAIHEGFKEIRIYGVDMAVDTEYFWQRPSCEYFLGVAKGLGINVWMPDACDLLKNRFLYGFQEHQSLPYEEKMRNTRESLKKKHQTAQQQLAFAQKQLDQYTGAMLAIDENIKTWKNVTGG